MAVCQLVSITAGWTGSGILQARRGNPLKFTAVAQAQEAARALHAGNRGGTVQHTVATRVGCCCRVGHHPSHRLTATSRERIGKGEWIVVARATRAPTSQVLSGS